MKDWLFYPMAAAVIAGIIWHALSLAQYEAAARQVGFTVEGEALTTLYASDGTSFSIAGDTVNPHAYAVMTAHISRALAPPSAGVFVTLGPDDEKAYAGKKLRITVRARKGRGSPSRSFDVAYFTNGAGDSNWKSFDLGNDFEDHIFEFTPNLPVQDPGNNYVGVWPDVGGSSKTVDVKSIKIEVLGAQGQ